MGLIFEKEIANEVSVSEFVPYSHRLTENTVKMHSGDICNVIKIQGVAHESSDIININGWHNQLAGLMRNLFSPNIAVHTHILRRECKDYPKGDFENDFCKRFNDKYREYVTSEVMYVNELYITIIFRAKPDIESKILGGFDDKAAQEALDDATRAAMVTLSDFDPELLGIYQHGEYYFDEVLEFFAWLINGEWIRMPLPNCDIKHVLGHARANFGKGGLGLLERPTSKTYFAVIGFEDYQTISHPGILNGLIKLPFTFVVSQSFTFIPKHVALDQMSVHKKRLISSRDASVTQIDEIDHGMDGLTANQFVNGAHSICIVVKAKNKDQLNKNINSVGSVLSDIGVKWSREDLAMQGAFYSQLPGNFKYRINIKPITSLNFCGMNSFHNFPSGRIDGSQWGNAVTMFRTRSGAPYYFNFHAGETGIDAKKAAKFDPNYYEAASTITIGKPGTGKTVLFGVFLAQLQKFREGGNKLTCVVFDRDMGSAILIRAAGGRYYPLKVGVPSGLNPLQIGNTPGNIEFLNKLVKELVRHDSYPLTPMDEKAIANAIDGVMRVDKSKRRLSSVKEFLLGTDSSSHSIGERLAKWCQGGTNGWLFDNDVDTLEVDLPMVGFDVTEFLESEAKTPAMMYLMHRIKGLRDGRRLPIFMSEFGILLSGDDEQGNSIFAEIAEKNITQGRKHNLFFCGEAQDFRQLVQSKATYAFLNQTSTKIFLPNNTANKEDYIKYGKLTNQEFEIIRNLGEKSRCVLIKQGLKSVVAQINLKGFEDELAVLSGNVLTSALCEQVVAELGDDPAIWLPEFHKRRAI